METPQSLIAAGAPETTPGTLDHEYNTRAWAQDFEGTLARHKAMGDAARATPGALLAMPWGARPRQRFDLFLPQNDRGPLVVYLHGGYWQYRASGKEGGSFLAPDFLASGIAFAAVAYELCPEVNMDEMVEQIREAMLWLCRNSAGLGYEIERLVVVGHSAGGHLATMMALTDWERFGARRNLVQGACGVSGLYDLRPIAQTYLNAAIGMDLETAWRNSPIANLRPDAPPLLLAVGANESSEFKRQMNELARAARDMGIRVATFELAGRDHYQAIEDVTAPGHRLAEAVRALARGEA